MPAARGRLRIVKRLKLDGAVYASPLVVDGATIVATENNTVYAFGPHLGLLWKRHLGRPSPQSQRPCGDIDPLGITGTPVYDSKANAVFVAPEISGSPPTHQLVKIGFRTGRVLWRRSLDFRGVDRATMQQRGALALNGARVFVPFGGLAGDCGNYKGRVAGRLRTTGRKPRVFTVPTAREAGIWSTPGPVVDKSGDMFVSVGNGAATSGDPYDHSDSVLNLTPLARLQDSFSPKSWASENASDLDLGSQGPAVVGKWVFIAGKGGTGYVLRRDHLGGIGGEVSSRPVCVSFGGTAVRRNVVYVPCTDGVRAVRIGTRGRMHLLWHAADGITGSPVVGGGRVWALNPDTGVLHALGLPHGGGRGRIAVSQTSRFATPAIFGPDVFVPTMTGLTVVATS
jgi:outer membrane protein assembly factor BamB